jgi:hypothetical protein
VPNINVKSENILVSLTCYHYIGFVWHAEWNLIKTSITVNQHES